MAYFLYALFFLSCIVLIASVLLQPGKTDAGALFTSNISSSAFQQRGTQSVLSRISIVAAIVFMLSALFLAMPALNGNISVLQTSSGETPTETAPAMTDANANVDVNAANVDANSALQPNVTVNTTAVTGNTAVNIGSNPGSTELSNAVPANKSANK
ncbi:MAG: preprotein translocase subunit SecG [Pyrinomonadaceae bacterium]